MGLTRVLFFLKILQPFSLNELSYLVSLIVLFPLTNTYFSIIKRSLLPVLNYNCLLTLFVVQLFDLGAVVDIIFHD